MKNRETKSWNLMRCKGLFLALTLSVGILFSSCDDWSDKDDYLYRKIGIVQKSADEKIIKLDRGWELHPESPLSDLTEGERIIADFTVEKEMGKTPPTYEIKLYNTHKVLTKDVLEYQEEISDSLGTDPLRVNDAWIANGYINFDFTFLGGKPQLKHMVNLAVHPRVEGEDFILLEFRHNAYEDPYERRQWGIVSFSTASLLDLIDTPEAKTINLKIQYKGFNGQDRTFDLKWNTEKDEEEEDRSIFSKDSDETGMIE